MGESWGYDVVDPFLTNDNVFFTLKITYQNLERTFDVTCNYHTYAVTSKLLTTVNLNTNETVHGFVVRAFQDFPGFWDEMHVRNDPRWQWLQEKVLPIADRASFIVELDRLRLAPGNNDNLLAIARRVAEEIFEQRIRPKDMPFGPKTAEKVKVARLNSAVPRELLF